MNAKAFEPPVEELRPAPNAATVFRALAARPHCLFLDSARRHPQLGRYSFVTADPFDWICASADEPGAFEQLGARVADYQSQTLADLPPFQGGAAGLFSYDLGRQFERLPRPHWDEFQSPDLAVGLYDTVIAFDHLQDKVWIISQGFPEHDPARRRKRAAERIETFRRWLAEPLESAARPSARENKMLALSDLAPQYPVGRLPGLTSNFSRPDYLAAIRRAIDYIAAGDIFQVNLAQRLLFPAADDSLALYLRLRERNPATFAGYFDLGDFQIVSASPERFLQVRNRQVEARPIKGTRQRSRLPEADLFAGDDLRQSEKDRAENVMIVDLLRNDLSRVCTADSVRVTQLCGLEQYEYVQHLVSAVCGHLRDEVNPLDLVRAAFPGGSITGAPKVRAMEIIAKLEPTARGPYCGALGYLGFNGALDTNILIRTVTSGRGWWQFPVGGGITYQSVPELEYDETWHKAEGILRALQ